MMNKIRVDKIAHSPDVLVNQVAFFKQVCKERGTLFYGNVNRMAQTYRMVWSNLISLNGRKILEINEAGITHYRP